MVDRSQDHVPRRSGDLSTRILAVVTTGGYTYAGKQEVFYGQFDHSSSILQRPS